MNPMAPGHLRVAHHRPPRDVPVALLVEDVGFVLAVVVVFEIKVSKGRIRVSIQRWRLDPGLVDPPISPAVHARPPPCQSPVPARRSLTGTYPT